MPTPITADNLPPLPEGPAPGAPTVGPCMSRLPGPFPESAPTACELPYGHPGGHLGNRGTVRTTWTNTEAAAKTTTLTRDDQLRIHAANLAIAAARETRAVLGPAGPGTDDLVSDAQRWLAFLDDTHRE
jgi:hypothetical protein